MPAQTKAMTYQIVPGRKIILVKGTGQSNAAEIHAFADSILEDVKDWKESGWAYVADCSDVTPVSMAESEALIELTRRIVTAGCKVLAFAEGKSFMIKIQAKNHTERSHTHVAEGHFKTVEQALDWVEKEFHY